MSETQRLHVVAAAVVRGDRVFLARRGETVHCGGLWEFPGGKVEPGEPAADALSRELLEEIGIEAGRMRPLIQVPYDYPDRKVFLDVWLVSEWTGDPRGAEGQHVAWVERGQLDPAWFPSANAPIVTALRLPSLYLITPDATSLEHRGLRVLHERLKQGIRLVQLRASSSSPADELRPVVVQYAALCKSYGARLLVSSRTGLIDPYGADGVHLTAADLDRSEARPPGSLVGASCHDARELRRAAAVGVDFAVLSPVRETSSHPDSTPLGWQRFEALVRDCPLPVYALGGVGPEDLEEAWAAGAQGVAGISKLWSVAPNVQAHR